MVFLPFDARPFTNQLHELDSLRASLDARPLVMGWSGHLARDLEARVVQASTNMEGVPVTVEEVRRILAGDRPENVSVEDASLVTGYRDAMEYCQRRADDDVFTWSPELLKAIQDKILAGRQDWGAGRYGKGRFVTNKLTGELIFTPPQDGVDQLVEELCQRMNAWDAHPALAAAWVHIALAAIHPFKDGNGRTARVLASLAMYRGGFKRHEFTSLEEWWGRHRATYANSFKKCLGAVFDRTADVTPFIAAHVSAQISQGCATQQVERTVREVWQGLAELARQMGLPERTAILFWDAFNGRTVTRPFYMAVANLKEGAAKSDLRELAAAGLMVAEGNTRARRWSAGPQFFPRLGMLFGLAAEDSNRDSILHNVANHVMAEATQITKSGTDTFSSSATVYATPSPTATGIRA